MAGNGEHAMKFVNELLDKIKAPFFREMETLRSLKARLTGQENARLNPWDVAYYANLRAEEHFRLDQEELRRHFPLPRVLDGLFSLAERLYGIRVKEIPTRQSLSGIPAGESGIRTCAFSRLTTATATDWVPFTWIFSPVAINGPERG